MGRELETTRQIKQFCDTIDSNGLVDLGWKAHRFTWNNGHSNSSFTKERLDRVLANQAWMRWFEGENVEPISSGWFDHLPIILRLRDSGRITQQC